MLAPLPIVEGPILLWSRQEKHIFLPMIHKFDATGEHKTLGTTTT